MAPLVKLDRCIVSLSGYPTFSNFKSEISDISDLKLKEESISRQLRAWADSLQNTDIRGTRYLTDKSRQFEKQARERQEFLVELDQIRNRQV